MCINNSHDSGSKSCGQAAYVIYNQSAESYMKFKQVESQVDFNKIDNYEYRYASYPTLSSTYPRSYPALIS